MISFRNFKQNPRYFFVVSSWLFFLIMLAMSGSIKIPGVTVHFKYSTGPRFENRFVNNLPIQLKPCTSIFESPEDQQGRIFPIFNVKISELPNNECVLTYTSLSIDLNPQKYVRYKDGALVYADASSYLSSSINISEDQWSWLSIFMVLVIDTYLILKNQFKTAIFVTPLAYVFFMWLGLYLDVISLRLM